MVPVVDRNPPVSASRTLNDGIVALVESYTTALQLCGTSDFQFSLSTLANVLFSVCVSEHGIAPASVALNSLVIVTAKSDGTLLDATAAASALECLRVDDLGPLAVLAHSSGVCASRSVG